MPGDIRSLLGLCLAMAAGVMAPLEPQGPVDAAMLKRIASRLDGRTGRVIAIEASTPVPYVASQPDARTFVVELRDVVGRVRRRLHRRPASSDRGVRVENASPSTARTSRACVSRSISRCGRACAARAT